MTVVQLLLVSSDISCSCILLASQCLQISGNKSAYSELVESKYRPFNRLLDFFRCGEVKNSVFSGSYADARSASNASCSLTGLFSISD